MRRFLLRRAALRRLFALAAAAALAACQPVDDLAPEADRTAEVETETPLDAPVHGMPGSLTELMARAEPEALAWQDEPVLAEILVEVGRGSEWQRAALTYVAANADRQLVLTVTAEEVREELTTLAALQLKPLSPRAVAQIPALPPEAKQPAELVRLARAALRECRIAGAPEGVLYATGAPAAWNGRRWTAPPQWTATVATGDGAVQFDPLTGAATGCVTA